MPFILKSHLANAPKRATQRLREATPVVVGHAREETFGGPPAAEPAAIQLAQGHRARLRTLKEQAHSARNTVNGGLRVTRAGEIVRPASDDVHVSDSILVQGGTSSAHCVREYILTPRGEPADRYATHRLLETGLVHPTIPEIEPTSFRFGGARAAGKNIPTGKYKAPAVLGPPLASITAAPESTARRVFHGRVIARTEAKSRVIMREDAEHAERIIGECDTATLVRNGIGPRDEFRMTLAPTPRGAEVTFELVVPSDLTAAEMRAIDARFAHFDDVGHE